MSLAAKLIAQDLFVSFREIALTEFPLHLGRGPEADVQLGDRWVSREHCEIDCVDNVLLVRDLGSKHGTFVNGRSVLEAELRPGDLLNIGITRFVVQYDSATARVPRQEVALVS
jgi:pSer/pThr/pTyr-binding forkhead associated (FHA) protein